MNRRALDAISRRAFLCRVAWLAIAGAVPFAVAGSASRELRQDLPTTPGTRLAEAMAHAEGAARLGRAALAGGLVEGDVSGLMVGLRDTVPGLDGLLRDGSADDVRAAVDTARRRDFAARGAGLMRIEGWVVARTEARACALVALA